ncbi:MAG: ADP-ribosylglycohydrolase family protein [Blastocatellia bacterium]|nr:ADP-ribosylglycohydrolase family protein [Blastocatellia bacterium]MBN8723350.1 ADP-ribosylglycohydrolase family protein [Acidobacteriota bacterium]
MTDKINSANERLTRAKLSLTGLSIGDSLGDRFFLDPAIAENLISERALPKSPWHYTDDTLMAMSIVSILRKYEKIDQDQLAKSFGERYDNTRGYGPAMHGLLHQFRLGEAWQDAASSLFNGRGSYGNGAAMRIAPLGAYFADDLDMAIEQAVCSAEVTHTNEEAIAGAIAVAVAAAWAWRVRENNPLPTRAEFLDLILPAIPKTEVSGKVRKALDMDKNASLEFAVAVLGNGVMVSAQDTVPLALWCAATHLNDFTEAFWLTVSALGDRDTTCAIVGGIVALSAGQKSIPKDWLCSREALPNWPFRDS